jgi:hypothetical protein
MKAALHSAKISAGVNFQFEKICRVPFGLLGP